MKRFRNILYVADSSRPELKTFQRAVELAQSNEARLTAMIAVEKLPSYVTRLTPHEFEKARLQELELALKKLGTLVKGRVEFESKVVEGKPFLEIIREVLRNKRDLVIKAPEEGEGITEMVHGTTDRHLFRKCPCPLWLIRSTGRSSFQRILAAVDFNEFDPANEDTSEPLNRQILELAGSLASREKSELHIVHAWTPTGEDLMRSKQLNLSSEEIETYLEETRLVHQRWLDGLMHKMKGWLGPEIYKKIEPNIHLPKGRARLAIPALARKLNTDLIVMGTVARTGVPGFFVGNTAESILGEVSCSILAVKPDGFKTPVTIED